MHKEKEIKDTTEQDQQKEEVIRQLKKMDNPLLFRRVKAVLNEVDTLDRIQHVPTIQQLIEEEQNEDFQIRNHQHINNDSALKTYDARSAQPMFYLGVLSLLLIGALVTAFTEEELSPIFQAFLPWLIGLSGLVYLLFAVDLGLLFYMRHRSKERMNSPEKRRRLLTLLFPPLRIGSRDISRGCYIWIPVWHWSKVNEGLFTELKRRFVLPMIGIALLIVPVLIIEWKFLGEIKQEMPDLKIDLILDSVQTFIWCAFTFEFILMISISNRKLPYVKKNWIDLLIILLPFVSFLRTLRISQIARLKYATRSFKLRGVITKARQGLIFVDFLQRLFRLRPETELKRLYRLLRENQRDREALQEKLIEVVKLMEKNQKRK
ncbi:hypothetical protein OKW21_004856 [Catalinimonas alkaloidigena]|uniref:hypothetical protein n=1 Tax=Catalinimonas alkaloidigena TaxID=1075417 RepID=UPI0024064737|nr:hypothetical protein [Catalinimonas alkaloidigena]MDF9799593.1 hypothetical protein [Catalinimonas alkaloidigena]